MGIVIFIGVLGASIIGNHLIDYNTDFTLWFAVIMLVAAASYVASRFLSMLVVAKVVLVSCVLFTLLLCWFIFAGHEGATPYYIITGTLLVWFLSRKWAVALSIGLVGSYTFLVFFETQNPQLVIPYPSEDIKFWDTAIAQMLVFVTFIFSNWLIRSQFEQTTKRNDEHYKEIKAQRDQLEKMKRELEKNQLALEKRNNELMISNDQKSRLFSIISHDLRSPLSGIQNSMRLLKMNALDKAESDKIFSLLDQDLTLTMGMLENLLTWSTMQIQGCTIKPELLNVRTTLQETLQLIESYANNKNIQVECKIDHDMHVNADSESLKLIVRNLTMNAVKFSHPDSTISLLGSLEVEYTEIRITDKGKGMSADQVHNLFEGDAVSSPGTNNEYGTGLGLKLCKAYIEKHNGHIHCESSEGGGTVFRVRFPN
jgi:two-component system, sensor histidine kinase LadS